MSKVALSGNASGTGTFTIASPNSNSDRTLNLPDADGTVQVSGNPISGTTGTFSGNVTLGSSVLATPTGSAPSYTCRAWVNFDGTGTIAIRASGNVSSITDNGTGDYTVNFTTAMPDANYAPTIAISSIYASNGSAVATVNSDGSNIEVAPTTTAFRVQVEFASSNTQFDAKYVNVAVFR